MKNPPLFLSLPLAAVIALAPQICSAQSEKPTGEMSVNTELVRQGAKPEITWSVTYPGLPFDPPTQTTTEDVTIHVSVFGVALESGNGDEIAASARLEIGSSWHNLFSGKGSSVDPSRVVLSKDVDAGVRIRLGVEGSNWGERISGSSHVVVLKNGDVPPTYSPALNQGDIMSFLSAYMSNGKVSIGPKDVIYLAELYSSELGSYWYDMQDIVVHVRFEERTTTVTD